MIYTIHYNTCMIAGMMSATATLGLVQLWDVDGGLAMIDKYLYSSEDYIKVNCWGKYFSKDFTGWRLSFI